MFVPGIEAAVEDYSRHVQIPDHIITALRELVTSEFDQANAHLNEYLALAGDCHKLYMSIDDSLRRICNQAFCEKIASSPTPAPSRTSQYSPFNMLFRPEAHTLP